MLLLETESGQADLIGGHNFSMISSVHCGLAEADVGKGADTNFQRFSSSG